MNNYLSIYVIICFVVLLFATSAHAKSEYPLLDELFALSEDQIDIGIVALKLAEEIYPDLDINAYNKKIDSLVKSANLVTVYSADSTGHEQKIRALNTYLYKYYKLKYDLTDPMATKPENRNIKGILDTKKGSCVTMPLLYLVVAQRLGYPVYPVALPSHLIVRYVDPAVKLQNIEATNDGGYVPDDEYRYTLKISDQGIKSGSYMRNMTNREFMGDLIADNAIHWAMQGDLLRAIAYMHIAIQMNPKFADHYLTIGKMYVSASKKSMEPLKGYFWGGAQGSFRRADELGVVMLDNTNYVEQQKKVQAQYRQRHGGAK